MKRILKVLIFILMTTLLVSCFNNDNNNEHDNNNQNEQPIEETIKDHNFKYDIYYHLFVRSFADSNGDGIGDLNGVKENLDYLEDLGVTAIWMLPIHTTDNDWGSYHGYRVKDYYNINPEYGTIDDYKSLISEAHKRDMKIVLDLVINHASDRHPWYSENEKPSDWFYHGEPAFGGGYIDFNLNNKDVEKEIINIVNFYIDLGVDGFRIDAAKHLFDFDYSKSFEEKRSSSSEFLGRVKKAAENNNPNVFFVGEVFDYNYQDYKMFYKDLDSLFDFYVASEIWGKLGNERPEYLLSNIHNAYKAYERYNKDFIPSLFLSNHDIDRLAGWDQFNDQNGFLKQKQAASVTLTLPGSPHIYYGEEIGMKGFSYDGLETSQGTIYDHYRRAPFLWGDNSKETTWLEPFPYDNTYQTVTVNESLNNSDSLLNHYKTMINLRKVSPALMYGNQFELWQHSTTTLQGIIREYDDGENYQKLLIIYNISNEGIYVDVNYNKILYGSLNIPKFGTLILEID